MKKGMGTYAKYLIYVMAVVCLVFLFMFNFILYPIKYKKEINIYSDSYGVDRVLVASIICVESSFNENAKSKKGALGLMQLMPATAKWLCEKKGEEYIEEKLLTAEYNINLGTYYLKYLMGRFDSIDNAILAYNAGEGVVNGWLKNGTICLDGKTIEQIPYPETSAYLTKVKRAMNVYKDRI